MRRRRPCRSCTFPVPASSCPISRKRPGSSRGRKARTVRCAWSSRAAGWRGGAWHSCRGAADPSWRGEENFFLKFYTFLDAEIRRWRPDAQINCGSGNWFLAHLIDVNRDWDILSDDPAEHENRCRMFRATAPGVPVQYDFSSTCRESYPEYLASARSVGASVEVGSLFRTQDVLMRPVDPGPGWFELLRTALPRGH